MKIRNIAVLGGFAAGAALAFAPLASADTSIVTTVDSEIASANSLFTEEANLAGVPSTDIEGGTTAGSFEFINPADVSTVAPDTTVAADVTQFEDLVYGLDPIAAGIGSDTGSYDLFNGALGEFDDAYNVGLYALENNGAMLPAADFATDLFGNTSSLTSELAGTTASQAITDLLGNAYSDLLGYL